MIETPAELSFQVDHVSSICSTLLLSCDSLPCLLAPAACQPEQDQGFLCELADVSRLMRQLNPSIPLPPCR